MKHFLKMENGSVTAQGKFKLRNISVGKKLALLVGAQMLGLVALLVLVVFHSRSDLLEERKLATRNLVEAAWGILDQQAKLAATGSITADEARQRALAAVRELRYAGQEYFWINDMQPRMIMHPMKPELDGKDLSDNKDPDGTRLFVEFVNAVKRDGQGFVFYRWPKPGATEPIAKVSFVKGYAPWGWIIGSGVYIDDINDAALASSMELVALSLVLGIVIGFFALIIGRAVTRPLRQTVVVLDSLAQGDGDLTVRLEAAGRDEIGTLAQSFNTFMDKLHGIIAQANNVSEHVTAAARQLSSASEHLSSGSQEQASSLEETAASLEEITGTVKQNADNAKQANQFAVGSRDTAEKGGQVVSEAVTAMGEINKSSKKIADIITTIDEIAFQTNLLALNAAVEAARAGEQGRGFAVVAAEVRSLAQRSATAAKEIKGLIQDSVQKVQDGSELVNKSGQTLHEIVSSVKKVTDIIGEIAAASQEQSSGIDQVNKAVGQMDQVVQSNAAQTEELSSTAQSLSSQAEKLQMLVGRFKVDRAALGMQAIDERVNRRGQRPLDRIQRMAPPDTSAQRAARSIQPANGHAKSSEVGFEEF